MFTGLIGATAAVTSLVPRGEGALLCVERPPSWSDLAVGESVSVSGVCLTVLESPPSAREVRFDVSPETLRRSTLGGLAPSRRVNLERAMRADGRFGGHMVAGHVDGTSRVERVERSGDFWTFSFGLDASWGRYVVEKGSVALDGVSLTVASVGDERLDVAVIPLTFACTTLGERRPGERVNVEVDVLGKYVERLLGAWGSSSPRERDERLRRLLADRG